MGNRSMILRGVTILNGKRSHIRIADGRIAQVFPYAEAPASGDDIHLHIENGLVLPGLINSHDHLEFNLFPQLGNARYRNYLEWGPDIHLQDRSLIDAVLRIPLPLRMRWGMYKNLIAGVTTVLQHGPDPGIGDAPIRIFTETHTLHSVRLEKGWKYKLNKPFAKSWPYVIHTGEGTDAVARQEIGELIRWNILRRRIVAIHGVAMTRAQAKHFDALVWCPDSNFFLLGATAAVDQLKKDTKILFGTDAAVSAHWNIWQQLRSARAAELLEEEELIDAVTAAPAKVWGLPRLGQVAEQYDADIVVVKAKAAAHTDAFFAVDPEDIQLVLYKGKPVLFDASLAEQLLPKIPGAYSRFRINNVVKYVAGDLPALTEAIKKYYPACTFPIEIL